MLRWGCLPELPIAGKKPFLPIVEGTRIDSKNENIMEEISDSRTEAGNNKR